MASLDEIPSVPMPRLTPLRIAGVYLVFGLSWIYLSDGVLWALTDDGEIRLWIEATKGTLFVLVSSGLIYWLTRRARHTYAETQGRLEKRNRELSIFHRIVRHNLRNVATVLTGRAEAAAEAEDPDPHLAVIERKSDRLRTLAEKASLLRGVSDDQSARRVQQDLCQAVTEICDQHRESDPDADIAVDCPDCIVTMVPARIGFAVSELVENAIVHAGPDATVVVTVDGDDEYFRITVDDDGPGIPDVERTAIEGTVEDVLDHSEGVGLWLVRLIVENAGGDLAVVESDLGGTAVRLTFARVEPDEDEEPAVTVPAG
ncbi:hypothetical protein GJ629_14495 [Halapricum sp. CBA1109]|uniref:sensor histidine kinase n=1 Tax=Halapricum sp. CBA1109 TaxID=2668068 RepID=UPI0012F72596|nr:HAMP domain-containing sensor histidine kinase [Halapricum sp. CBA1109]MUV90949.1 hypothetical protein [Halapricum sp. CBA1109]